MGYDEDTEVTLVLHITHEKTLSGKKIFTHNGEIDRGETPQTTKIRRHHDPNDTNEDQDDGAQDRFSFSAH